MKKLTFALILPILFGSFSLKHSVTPRFDRINPPCEVLLDFKNYKFGDTLILSIQNTSNDTVNFVMPAYLLKTDTIITIYNRNSLALGPEFLDVLTLSIEKFEKTLYHSILPFESISYKINTNDIINTLEKYYIKTNNERVLKIIQEQDTLTFSTNLDCYIYTKPERKIDFIRTSCINGYINFNIIK